MWTGKDHARRWKLADSAAIVADRPKAATLLSEMAPQSGHSQRIPQEECWASHFSRSFDEPALSCPDDRLSEAWTFSQAYAQKRKPGVGARLPIVSFAIRVLLQVKFLSRPRT